MARAGTSPSALVSEHAANLLRRKGKASYHSKHLHDPHLCSSSASRIDVKTALHITTRRDTQETRRLQFSKFSAFSARKSSVLLTPILRVQNVSRPCSTRSACHGRGLFFGLTDVQAYSSSCPPRARYQLAPTTKPQGKTNRARRLSTCRRWRPKPVCAIEIDAR